MPPQVCRAVPLAQGHLGPSVTPLWGGHLIPASHEGLGSFFCTRDLEKNSDIIIFQFYFLLAVAKQNFCSCKVPRC